MQKLSIQKIIFGISILLLISSCSYFNDKGPQRGKVVSKLKSSAKLATVEYVVTKVIKSEKDNFILKNSYFFAQTEARIKAGINLDKLNEEDIEIEGTKIKLTLPPIEIINFSYPVESFKLIDKYTTKPGLFSKAFTLEQRDELYRQGEKSIRASLKDLGIIERAKSNTKMLIEKILIASEFEEIYITFKEQEGLLSDQKERVEDQEEK